MYMPLLKGKNIALTVNQTSVIGQVHLLDSLVNSNTNVGIVFKVFSPEHGFRGDIAEGMVVKDRVDEKTGIPIISLYGANKKPSPDDLRGIDIMIYDIQDVGVRFYTYISTLHLVMEACAEQDIPVIILDRPNPLGYYVDGPVLEPACKSFVGMHPIPVVYGMTAGELARMINGEGWLGKELHCDLTVITCQNYSHHSRYRLPVNPSPNLRSMKAVYLYPSLCFFEGTMMNVGRGTPYPFLVFGHPDYPVRDFSYTPVDSGHNSAPLHKGLLCFGENLRRLNEDSLSRETEINLSWLIGAYKQMDKTKFFNSYFENLAGNKALRKQIETGIPANKIRESWEPELEKFRQIRAGYLLYPD
jgi:uncharacterized protein YbbC (DUF1343 family)